MTATADKAEKKESKDSKKKKGGVMTFILRKDAGLHFEPNHDFDTDEPEEEDNLRDIEYAPGDKVKSTRQLDKIFVNKFERMQGDATGGQSAGGDTYDDAENDPDRDRPVTSVEDALARRPDRYLEEEELEGKPDLIKKSKGQKMNRKEKEEDDEESEDEEDSEASDFGEDVSDEFETASDAGVKVLKDDNGKYRVFEEGDTETPMDGAKKGFKKKSEVKAFIKKQTSSSDDE